MAMVETKAASNACPRCEADGCCPPETYAAAAPHTGADAHGRAPELQ